MAGRKKKKDSSGGGAGGAFESNPFKQLKGFAVSAPQQSRRNTAAKPQAASLKSAPSRPDDADLFAAEMARLGVAPREGAEPFEPRPAEASPSSPVETTVPDSDRDLFLEALKGMDTVFEDEFPADEEKGGQAAPRRMKLLRQGRLTPEAKLDLHGLTREEARTKVSHFLDDSAYQGKKTVLIVTGRGKGSAEGPVLRGEIERYLMLEGAGRIGEWDRAPARYGGEGALVVFLKGMKEN